MAGGSTTTFGVVALIDGDGDAAARIDVKKESPTATFIKVFT